MDRCAKPSFWSFSLIRVRSELIANADLAPTNAVGPDGDGFFDAEELEAGDPDSAEGLPADQERPIFAGLTSANATGPTSVALSWLPATDRHTAASQMQYLVFVAESQASMPCAPENLSVRQTGATEVSISADAAGLA